MKRLIKMLKKAGELDRAAMTDSEDISEEQKAKADRLFWAYYNDKLIPSLKKAGKFTQDECDSLCINADELSLQMYLADSLHEENKSVTKN